MQNRYYSRIVIKLGTSTLTDGTTHISPPRLVDLVSQMSRLLDEGREVAVVSSGAMQAGREKLHFPSLPKEIPAKQMLAAIGQPRLMSLYEQLFGLYGKTVAQVLLTRQDLSDRRRYLNSRNTLSALLTHRIVPIINENDTVATEEIRVGDNDNLSALVSNLIEADLLILLTDQDGLYTSDPRRDASAILVKEVATGDIPETLWLAAGGTASGLGTGGMITKLQSADLARRSGTEVIIANGTEPNVVLRLASGEKLGTRFLPSATALEARKRFILAGGRTIGVLKVDVGAARALQNGGSLLPVGVTLVNGNFERGATVRILDEAGHEIGRGLVNYGSGELAQIAGERSEAIASILGFDFGEEVIHRNNMVIMTQKS